MSSQPTEQVEIEVTGAKPVDVNQAAEVVIEGVRFAKVPEGTVPVFLRRELAERRRKQVRWALDHITKGGGDGIEELAALDAALSDA